jgi:hypothetical protein
MGPTLDLDTVDKLDAGFPRVLLRLGIVLRAMRALNLNVTRDLLPLLATWTPIGTRGRPRCIGRCSLNPTILDQDAAFDDNGFGEFFYRDGTQRLLNHGEALRAAFNLTGEEFDRIVSSARDRRQYAAGHREYQRHLPSLDGLRANS